LRRQRDVLLIRHKNLIATRRRAAPDRTGQFDPVPVIRPGKKAEPEP